MNGQERNKQSLNALFSAKDKYADMYSKMSGYDIQKDSVGWYIPEIDEHFYSLYDLKKFLNENKKNVQSSRRPVKSTNNLKIHRDEFGLIDKYIGEHFDITVERGALSSNRISGYTVRDKDGNSMEMSFMTLSEAKNLLQELEDKGIQSSRKSIKSERVTNGGKFTDVMFELIDELKLKKDYRITRPSWNNFDFDHKYKDGSFTIYIDENNQVVYGSVLGFGEHDNDIFKYETEKINVDSYNLKRECRKIIIDCMNYLNNTIGIVSFEITNSRRPIKSGYDENEISSLISKYTNELKSCTTGEEVQNVVHDFYYDENVSKYVASIRTRSGKPVNSFFTTNNPSEIEYTTDWDVGVRKCKVQNLYKFIRFELNIPHAYH